MSCCGDRHHHLCPTHPDHPLSRICMSLSCIQPLCQRCVLQHSRIHEQLKLPLDLRPITQVNRSYLTKVETRASAMQESYNRRAASTILKKYVDDFYRTLDVDDRMMVSQRKNLVKSDVKSLIEVMMQDNRTDVGVGFREKLHAFLRENLGGGDSRTQNWDVGQLERGFGQQQSNYQSNYATQNTIFSQPNGQSQRFMTQQNGRPQQVSAAKHKKDMQKAREVASHLPPGSQDWHPWRPPLTINTGGSAFASKGFSSTQAGSNNYNPPSTFPQKQRAPDNTPSPLRNQHRSHLHSFQPAPQ